MNDDNEGKGRGEARSRSVKLSKRRHFGTAKMRCQIIQLQLRPTQIMHFFLFHFGCLSSVGGLPACMVRFRRAGGSSVQHQPCNMTGSIEGLPRRLDRGGVLSGGSERRRRGQIPDEKIEPCSASSTTPGSIHVMMRSNKERSGLRRMLGSAANGGVGQ